MLVLQCVEQKRQENVVGEKLEWATAHFRVLVVTLHIVSR